MKTKISVGSCFIQVQGMEMRCPFCLVVVKSGQTHRCNPKTIEVKPGKKP